MPTDTPLYFFISLTRDKTVPGWIDAFSGYLSRVTIGRQMELEADHYLYYEAAEIIVEEAKLFLEQLK